MGRDPVPFLPCDRAELGRTFDFFPPDRFARSQRRARFAAQRVCSSCGRPWILLSVRARWIGVRRRAGYSGFGGSNLERFVVAKPLGFLAGSCCGGRPRLAQRDWGLARGGRGACDVSRDRRLAICTIMGSMECDRNQFILAPETRTTSPHLAYSAR